jgi:hypothetical protein
MSILAFFYFLSKCPSIGLQKKQELINVSIARNPKEIKQENFVFKCPLLPWEMPCNSYA